jgi:non-ribosomal peptide synthetase component E (peptide arylation enzyme)
VCPAHLWEINRASSGEYKFKEWKMSNTDYNPGEHHEYPLILKKLLNTPLTYAPDQEIIYRDKLRYTYRDLNDRIQRLAGGLEKLGVAKGDVVASLGMSIGLLY